MSLIPTHPLKLLRRLPLAVACVLMGMATVQAQTTPPSLLGHESDAQVLPVWNTRSGRVEALLLLSPDQDKLNPLDRVFPRETTLPGVGLGVTLDNGSRLRGTLQPEPSAGLALLCSQGIHVAMTLGPLGQQCLLAQIGSQDDLFLPAPIVEKLNALCLETLKDPAVKKRFAELGFFTTGSTPQAYLDRVRFETERWTKVVKENNIKVEG